MTDRVFVMKSVRPEPVEGHVSSEKRASTGSARTVLHLPEKKCA